MRFISDWTQAASRAAWQKLVIATRGARTLSKRNPWPQWRRLGAWMRNRQALRLTLGTRALLVLVAVATTSTALSVFMQGRAMSVDLDCAAHTRLEYAAELVSLLLDERLVAQTQRYRSISSSPQFLANVETGHEPTLTRFAEGLRPQNRAEAIVFLGADARELGASGAAGLRAAAREALAHPGLPGANEEPADDAPAAAIFAWAGTAFSAVRVPIADATHQPGSLVAVERIGQDTLATWSRLCQANVLVGAPAADSKLLLTVRPIGDLQLRIEASPADEVQTLEHSRANLLAGGMLGLALTLAASILLARNLVRPIRAIQQATDLIGTGDLGIRLDEGRNDEIGDVARSFNLMLDNLQRTVQECTTVENQISHLSFHDSLTGLPNRRLLKKRLSDALERSPERQSRVAVLCLDLDRFKSVNDTLGHTAGDSMLLEVACRLHTCVETFAASRPSPGEPTVLARLGGDEFTIVLPDIESRSQVTDFADRILAVLSRPFDVLGHEVSVGASLGIALAPDDGQDVETLLRDSDMAMFHAKGRGGRGYEFYADSMEEIVGKRLALESKLHRALENGEFELCYQPKVDLASNQVTGMEALLRWRLPDQQIISPEEFLPLAEETGAIVPIGDWVMRTAVAQCLAWQAEGLAPVRMAVNVSARQIEHRDDFVTKVRDLLTETGLDPHLLELEITESSMLKDESATVALLERLREVGVSLSLDDFGTGYSSLSYLRRLPIDTLKIDRSFIQGQDGNPEDAALVGAIIAMAKVLGLRVVVEGVETKRQRRFLEQLGCDEFQGFLFSQAVPAAEAAAILRRRPRSRGRRRSQRAQRE